MSEAVARSEAVIWPSIDIAQRGPAVPASHILAGSRKPCTLAVGLEQAVLIEAAVENAIGIKLLANWPIQQLYVAVSKLAERSNDGRRILRS